MTPARGTTSRAHLVALVALAGAACASDRPAAPPWHQEDGYRWRELAVARRGREGFTRMRTAIQFTNTAEREETLRNQHLHVGSGVALGDVDGDGLVDVYLASLEGPSALYRNLGGWRFEEITEQAGVQAPDRYATGAVFADVDGDGDLDLLVSAISGPNALFLNDGHGRFTEATAEAGLSSDRASLTMTLADVDGDGDLDLYVANYKFVDVSELYTDQELSFNEAARQVGPDAYEVIPELAEHFRFEKVHGEWVRMPLADPDWFYLNDGAGRFAAVPFTSERFRDADGRRLAREPETFGLAARFHDVDGDGDPDLYVCNDFEGPDQFWINDGTGRFQEIARTAVRNTSNASMAVDFADIERDGDVDLFVVDMLARSRHERHTHNLAHPPPPGGREIESRPQWQRNTLMLNRGDATFAQAAEYAGVDASDWSWTTLFLDVDLDGYEDILVANGYTWDVFHLDVSDELEARFPRLEWRELRHLYPAMPQRNVAFRNNGDLTFSDAGERWRFGTDEDISHGMAPGDLDGDGDLDLVINRLGSPALVLRNDAAAGRVAVRLVGQAPNTQGIGATIRVQAAGLPEQQKEATLGGLYLSGAEQVYAFATGDADALTVTVDWRSGSQSVIEGARPNRLYEVHEPAANDENASRPPSSGRDVPPYFRDVSQRLGHEHVDQPFNDFLRQPLLPGQLSHLGPGVTWYDGDGDGDEDLFIAAGRGGRLAYYRNDEGGFTRRDLAGASLDQTTVLAIAERPGRTALLVGQSTYEAAGPREALEAASVLRVGLGDARVSDAVAGDRSATGPLALADYDGDGDLDLFVGGRVIPVAYPAPASSRLFVNDNGSFTLDAENSRTLQGIGLVSGAVFSDLDGDGDPDLLLALEWGPLKIFLNDGGRFRDGARAMGLPDVPSRWNGIATGDFNGDGRPDVIATSWGRNTRYRVDAGRPLHLYFGDFDGNRTIDLLEAQRADDVNAVVPLTARLRLVTALPALRARAPTYADYADATVDELLGPAAERAFRVSAESLEHLLLLNRGNRMEPVPLPPEAQLAPAFYAGVADFDGDGHEDLFLSQNFFDTEIGTPRYDAGRGLWLKGDGAGALTPVPGHVSGVTVYGEQRGAALADFDQDARVDLVVSQNANQTTLYRNVRAAPGLRVRLVGPDANPHAFGATVRLVYGERRGPAREVQAGSGYWSQNGPAIVLGKREPPTAVWVRWPGGRETTTPVAPDAAAITIRMPD